MGGSAVDLSSDLSSTLRRKENQQCGSSLMIYQWRVSAGQFHADAGPYEWILPIQGRHTLHTLH